MAFWVCSQTRGGPLRPVKNKMKNARLLIFLALQVIVIGLGVMIGWNSGQPADRERLASLEVDLKLADDYVRWENINTIEGFQSVLERLQVNGDTTGAITQLNALIDGRIKARSGWAEFGCPRGLIWPGGEDEFRLILRIAEYRRQHPARQWPSIAGISISQIFEEAQKCQIRRASARGWKPPPPTEVQTIEIIGSTNSPSSEPSSLFEGDM